MAPGLLRLVGPVVCPSGTARTEVVAFWTGTARNGQTLRWEVYCLSPDGFGVPPDDLRLFVTWFAIWFLAVVLFLPAHRLFTGLLRRRA
ncbi:hypothetical protein WMF31_35765 [Sorangium sp. So ce1036]|uniref:hypothetical protein n=1 Tax=Sorangium sp. So ce1036 TaxID=3133328 RepID=UPI003F0FF484